MSDSAAFALSFRSADERFGLTVESSHASTLLRYCELAGSRETGGVLIGHYTDRLDWAVVTRVCGPSADSRAGATWFERGTNKLQAMFDEYWRRGRGYYLGEWHFHPGAAPNPSEPDMNSMRRIAQDPSCQCGQPVLLIIGGRPPALWSAAAHVFPYSGTMVELWQQLKVETNAFREASDASR